MLFSEFKAQRMGELRAMRDGATNTAFRVPGLLDLIARVRPQRVLEIGCFTGISTEVFLLHCSHVTAVDCWDADYIKQEFDSRVMAYPHLAVIQGRSPGALKELRWGDYDLCYIDADHSYEAVKADILACRALSVPGMWIGGHDYGWHDCPGVKQAVDEIFFAPSYTFCDSSWAIRET